MKYFQKPSCDVKILLMICFLCSVMMEIDEIMRRKYLLWFNIVRHCQRGFSIFNFKLSIDKNAHFFVTLKSNFRNMRVMWEDKSDVYEATIIALSCYSHTHIAEISKIYNFVRLFQIHLWHKQHWMLFI